jgi:hypothetical protein
MRCASLLCFVFTSKMSCLRNHVISCYAHQYYILILLRMGLCRRQNHACDCFYCGERHRCAMPLINNCSLWSGTSLYLWHKYYTDTDIQTITALNWSYSFNCHLFNSLVLLLLVVMLGRTEQKSQFLSIVVTALIMLHSIVLLAPVLLHTMEMKSTSRCIATDMCRISLMWEVPTSPRRGDGCLNAEAYGKWAWWLECLVLVDGGGDADWNTWRREEPETYIWGCPADVSQYVETVMPGIGFSSRRAMFDAMSVGSSTSVSCDEGLRTEVRTRVV